MVKDVTKQNCQMDRDAMITRLVEAGTTWDLLVIGGGATGIATALDAASRGLSVALVEQSDFGKSTSSRSTKLVHGGVRYLKQGNITLVRDALRERTLLKNNAPHLVRDLPFLIPCSGLRERLFYGLGLKLYGVLADRHEFGHSHGLSASEAGRRIPELKSSMARGGVIYHDGQFDDSRLLIAMARTAVEHGACLVNYVRVDAIHKESTGKINGLTARDVETGNTLDLQSRCVVNAAGPFCDDVRRMDDADCPPMLSVSQGIHLVLPKRFLPGGTAVMVPKTVDGRVVFIIPWRDHVIVGTTDTPIERPELEPKPGPDEIQFLLESAGQYLSIAPKIGDILSVFTGIRPLVGDDRSAGTASLSRDHVIKISKSNLVTITGGKWTTVRKMAEDCVDHVCQLLDIDDKPCITQSLRLHGFMQSEPSARNHYGSDLKPIRELERLEPELSANLHPELELYGSDVVWAVRHEMARTVDDVLARRNRALFLNASAAISVADRVARLMARELGRDDDWISAQVLAFNEIAGGYMVKQDSSIV